MVGFRKSGVQKTLEIVRQPSLFSKNTVQALGALQKDAGMAERAERAVDQTNVENHWTCVNVVLARHVFREPSSAVPFGRRLGR